MITFQLRFIRIYLILLLILIGSSVNSNANSVDDNANKKRIIVNNGQLFSESSSNDETVLDKNKNKIVQPTGVIGQLVKGQGVKTIHRIRFSRMQITLDDGRKGWVDIQLVSPSFEKDAFLLNEVKLSELMAAPQRGNSAIPINNDNKNIKFKRNTLLKVLEWKHEEEKNKDRIFQSGKWWAKVEIEGHTGWIESSRFRFKGQMFDSAIPVIWYPIRWISSLLGDGFWAGLFVLILLVVPMMLGYAIARLISTWLRFLPNIILYIIILLSALLIYGNTYTSIYDASAFFRGSIFLYALYGFLVFFVAISTFTYIRKTIYETRCPDCKHWEGQVYDSQKLSESTTTTKTTYHYSDGSQKREVNKTTIKSWKDSCCCQHCNYCWAIHRTEKIES